MVNRSSRSSLKEKHAESGTLSTVREVAFDRVVYTASHLFRMPLCAISFFSGDRQLFKASAGLEISETKRSDAFCADTMASCRALVVSDARLDDRFSMNPYVVGAPYIRFYAGQAIFGPNMKRVGTLCVMDRNVRHFTAEDERLLSLLAAEVSDLIVATAMLVEGEKHQAPKLA